MSVIEINLTVATTNETQALDAYEKIGRLAAGFGLDGMLAETSIDRVTYNDEAEDPTAVDDLEHADADSDDDT